MHFLNIKQKYWLEFPGEPIVDIYSPISLMFLARSPTYGPIVEFYYLISFIFLARSSTYGQYS